MKPSWLIVEYASTFFTSFCAMAMVAANSAVNEPTTVISASAGLLPCSAPAASSGKTRMTM